MVVSEFQPPKGEWIRYHVKRGWRENREWMQCEAWRPKNSHRGRDSGASHAVLGPALDGVRARAVVFSGVQRTRPALHAAPAAARLTILRHFAVAHEEFLAHGRLHPGGWIYTQFWRLAHPQRIAAAVFYRSRCSAVMFRCASRAQHAAYPRARRAGHLRRHSVAQRTRAAGTLSAAHLRCRRDYRGR